MIQYQQGQQFRAHYDLYDIDPRLPLPREESLRGISVLFYLSDVPENGGGETVFPLARPPLKVRPKKGTAIVWRNCIPFSDTEKAHLLASGDLSCVPKEMICCKERDWRSIHAGLPIQGQGYKFTMTRWVREGWSEDMRHPFDDRRRIRSNTSLAALLCTYASAILYHPP